MSHSPPVAAAEADVPVESEERQPSEGENTESQWLTMNGIKLADESKKESELPHIDVVHVTTMRPMQDLHNLDDLLMDVEVVDTRELIFQCDVSSILIGDLTNKAIELQATRLLHELIARQTTISVCIFTPSYDFGSLIVKMALSLAARFEDVYPGIFFNTIQIELDCFTGTLGTPTEIPVEEPHDGGSLPGHTPYSPKARFADSGWISMERTLLQLSAPHRSSQLDLRPAPALEPFLDAPAYKKWDGSVDSQILYIHGTSYVTTHELANKCFLAWRSKQRWKHDRNAFKSLSFTFSSTDPLRASISDMMASLVVQITMNTGQFHEYRKDVNQKLQDMFLIVILLHDFDECRPEGRSRFLDYYAKLSEETEQDLKLLITSRKPNALLPELKRWTKLDVDGMAFSPVKGDLETNLWGLSRFCPIKDTTDRIQKLINGLITMDPTHLHKILQLLQAHTGWPEELSPQCLSHFIRLLELVDSADTPERVLHKILRSHAQCNELCWTLNWLISGHRPVSPRQLAAILLQHRNHQADEQTASPTSLLIQKPTEATQLQLESWLRGFADFTCDEVTIRRDIWDLLSDDAGLGDDTGFEEFSWNEIRRSAHETIVEFCLAHLSYESTLAALKSLLRVYQSQVDRQQETHEIVAPMISENQEIALYLAEALPYHLSRCEPGYSANMVQLLLANSATESSTVWAKVYWAASNPLTRARRPPESTLTVLVGLGLASEQEVNKADDMSRAESLVALARSNSGDLVPKLLKKMQPQIETCTDVLLAALQAGDESTALQAVQSILSHPESNRDTYSWPWSVLWAATWLKMHNLVEKLLSNGVRADPQDSVASTPAIPLGFFVSPLYMASLIGHTETVKSLLRHGAKTDVLRNNKYGPRNAAAHGGHADVLRAFITQDPSVILARQPSTMLYTASDWGNRKAVKVLLELGSDPNISRAAPPEVDWEWTPLAAATYLALPDTVELLLSHGADPNRLNPYGADTPLWYAAVFSPMVRCVRSLLRHGGDPNHKHFEQPLMHEIAYFAKHSEAFIEICDALVVGERPIDVNAADSEGDTALMIASRTGNVTLVRWLLSHDADINALDNFNRSAIYWAVYHIQPLVVEELLKSQPKLDVSISETQEPILNTAIGEPTGEGTPTVVRLLLNAGANTNLVNHRECSSITVAAAGDNTDVAKMVIDKGVNVNQRDLSGLTPLCRAVVFSSGTSMVRLLVESGAKLDVTVDDEDGGSLLHLSLLDESPEKLRTLLEFRKDININALDNYKQTPLICATAMSRIQHLQLLIRAGADLNVQEANGATALHKAVRSDEVLQILLREPDTDINHMVPGIGSPLWLACRLALVSAVEILLNHGADIHIVEPNELASTTLMAAMLPYEAIRNQDAMKIDAIVRMLVFKGLAVQQTVPGNRFYTALSAGCFGAGVGTINFLIDEGASAQLADPVSGRLPLHYAAANGLENFQAILLPYRGDMMACDKEGKNCLHWAAQFGNAKTVEYILSKPNSEEYVNKPDSDGWTPLCWAVRQWDSGWCEAMRSESRDYIGVIRCLLQNKADPTVRCQLGNGTTTEALTPLDLARRSNKDDHVANFLLASLRERQESEDVQSVEGVNEPVQQYALHSRICDICLNVRPLASSVSLFKLITF
ncbi:hypothetical protein QQX98_001570 [Neonectria punicea]|uniref:Uncharacterized protein n=1 Tax=Neonectria punicea TaxID=979145 RepID=A0ABR1HN14_9HYPO